MIQNINKSILALCIVTALALIVIVTYDTYNLNNYRQDRRLSSNQIKTLSYDQLNKISNNNTTKRDVVLTSWFRYRRDPQRHVQVSKDIDYIYNMYLSSTHLKIPVIIFYDWLSDEFIEKYENEYVTFKHVEPDRHYSTNDFRFMPYLEYIIQEEENLDSVLMIDASDVFFNSNPFKYIHEHENRANQLFVSHDNGNTFGWNSWRVDVCYGEVAHTWPPGKQQYNAGVWGGQRPAVRCVLECINDQIQNHMPKSKNCNMPVVNWCLNRGPCNAQIHPEPQFVNPWKGGCRETKYPVVHNKCDDTKKGQTRVDIVNDEIVLVDTGIKLSKEEGRLY